METKEAIIMLLKICVFLPIIIFLIFLLFRYGGERLQKIQNGRYMKILDRLPLTKENSLLIIKIGEKAFVISSTAGKVEMLMELDPLEVKKIEESNGIGEYGSLKDVIYNLKTKREDK